MRKGIGTSIVALMRFASIQIDHYILKKEWAKTCGVDCILTITDSSTRITSYEVVENQSAMETARTIYDRWIPYYSTPVKITSDGAPGFASDVMTEMERLMGIKQHDLSAPESKGSTAQVENRHNNLVMKLADGFAKGDIRNARDLQTYCSRAKVKNDFEESDGASPFECAVGQMPRSSIDSALVMPDEIDIVSMHLKTSVGAIDEQTFLQWLEDNSGGDTKAERKTHEDVEIHDSGGMIDGMDRRQKAQLIHQHAEEVLTANMHKRNERARRNLLRRISKTQKEPHAYQMEVEVGSEVSYEGKPFTVTEVTPHVSRQTTAVIDPKGKGSERYVRVDKLRHAATPRPVKMLPREMAKEDDLVIWSSGDETLAGMVMDVLTDGRIVVHQYEGTEGSLEIWLPLWISESGRVERKMRKPKGTYQALEHIISQDSVLLIGGLGETGRMDAATRHEMHARDLVPSHVSHP